MWDEAEVVLQSTSMGHYVEYVTGFANQWLTDNRVADDFYFTPNPNRYGAEIQNFSYKNGYPTWYQSDFPCWHRVIENGSRLSERRSPFVYQFAPEEPRYPQYRGSERRTESGPRAYPMETVDLGQRVAMLPINGHTRTGLANYTTNQAKAYYSNSNSNPHPSAEPIYNVAPTMTANYSLKSDPSTPTTDGNAFGKKGRGGLKRSKVYDHLGGIQPTEVRDFNCYSEKALLKPCRSLSPPTSNFDNPQWRRRDNYFYNSD